MTQQDNQHGLSPEDIEYLRQCLDAYTDSPLQDGLLQYYLGQAGQSDTTIELRLSKEGYDFREKIGLPRK